MRRGSSSQRGSIRWLCYLTTIIREHSKENEERMLLGSTAQAAPFTNRLLQVNECQSTLRLGSNMKPPDAATCKKEEPSTQHAS